MTVHETTRRTLLKAAGATGVVTIAAGCLSGDDDSGNGSDDSDDGDATDGFEIDPGTQITFNGKTGGWEGLEPSEIGGETNPTLVLQEGETYEIGWTEGDGSTHNIAIRDDGSGVVDDLVTDQVSDPGDDQILEFEASSEMAEYVCEPHETTMNGEIQIQ